MKERLTKRLDDGSVEYENGEYIIRLYPQNEDCYNTEQKAILRLAEYEDLEEQGLLVRLRCKVGDKICKFNARPNGDIWVLEAKCLKIEINKKGTLFTFSTLVSRYLEEDFFAGIDGVIETDKYYVCDRTEAEKKLEELKEKKND